MLMAIVRRVLHGIFRPSYREYKTIVAGGYRGWYELPIIGVTAYVCEDDGSLQFKW